ncbi:sigma-54-dependent transcriptional regulator [Hydrogenovibrio marinus]|uniref:sigma-54-dependent transcriptional regulator n=1 Tax=Hydrogenovibrio marinus TaxID=28885 RepID=UPI0004A72761|nr:sigma-54 dependent transcriptional regulator [Hydrogenovibrio marinus]BBN59210.1 hydrogenase transcriptional regulatory protein HoxA [Hydrogenovibrio marinus]
MILEKPSVLVVDDDEKSVATLKRTLRKDFKVYTALSAEEAEEILRFEYIQVLVCDHRMPKETGVSFLIRVKEQWPDVIRVLLSGYSSLEDTIRGVNEAGIYQYIEKPWQPEQLIHTLMNAVELFELQRENRLLSVELKVAPSALEKEVKQKKEQLKKTYDCDEIVRTPDGLLDKVIQRVCQISSFDFPVLIAGESGTGKELFARAIHYNSARSDGPFLAENCGALPDQLLESELFGYKKGAFTGAYMDHVGLLEQVSGGTLFLDEIGEISQSFQVKLLRVLQEGEIRPLGHSKPRKVDVRIVAATNRNLEEEVKAGRFREDLFYRLVGYVVQLPSLHERTEDIPLLANAFLKHLCEQYARPFSGFTDEMMQCLMDYRWPGNIRELQNEIGRSFMMTPQGEPLRAEFCSSRVLRAAPEDMEMELEWVSGVNGSLKEKVAQIEEQIIREALIRLRWNKTKVAEELGLSRVGLRQKMERFSITENLGSGVNSEKVG